ncbi:MAG: hypothetical protein ABSF43_15770 [Rectinemataceae bacterium]|jgi:hypothetical protein
MVSNEIKRAVMYIVALVAVSFGIEWGFSYILSAHSDKLAKKRPATEAAP